MKRTNKILTVILAVVFVFCLVSLSKAVTTVNLGTASNFAILAGTGITNTGATTVTGDVGSSPTNTETGFTGINTVTFVSGTNHNIANPNDATTQGAKTDLTIAYNVAAGLTSSLVGSELGGTTKYPGVYNTADGELHITGTLTLDAQGDPNAVFIFKAASTLTTAGSSIVKLTNGAQACNVFWQIGSSATLGANSTFKGTILAMTSVTLTTGANVEGRLLARDGAVILDTNTVTMTTCTVTPTPVSSGYNTITIFKHVINDNGGTAIYTDFPLFINNNHVVSGQSVNLQPGTYTITETSLPTYKTTFAGDCDVNGKINHGGIGTHNDICTIINDDIGAPVVVPPVPPLIDVVKVPSPLALPAGPGAVTYTYTLRNIGTVPVTDVKLLGDTCSPIVLVSGDTNNNAKLDLNETWIHTCSTTLTATHTNTVVATGWANGISANDVASATVVVGVPIVPPLIHITKIPNRLTLPVGGGLITYTKKVTNPGTVALSNVRITDDKCGPVKFISGDTNKNSKLEPTETWTYTCQAKLTKTTVNTAVAEGEANNLIARDLAVATVVVATAPPTVPKLPNAGLFYEEGNNVRNIMVLVGAFFLGLASLTVFLHRRKI